MAARRDVQVPWGSIYEWRNDYKTGALKHSIEQTCHLFNVVFVPIRTDCHESWVMTKRVLSEVQDAEMAFLRRVHGVMFCDKMCSCEIRKDLNVEPLLFRIKRYQLSWFSHVTRMYHDSEASPAGYTHGKAAQRSSKDQVEWLHHQIFLISSWFGASRTTWDYCWPWAMSSPLGLLPPWLSVQEKRVWEWMDEW